MLHTSCNSLSSWQKWRSASHMLNASHDCPRRPFCALKKIWTAAISNWKSQWSMCLFSQSCVSWEQHPEAAHIGASCPSRRYTQMISIWRTHSKRSRATQVLEKNDLTWLDEVCKYSDITKLHLIFKTTIHRLFRWTGQSVNDMLCNQFRPWSRSLAS